MSRPIRRFAAPFLASAACRVVISDEIVFALPPEVQVQRPVQTGKGLAFAVMVALLLSWFLNHIEKSQARAERARRHRLRTDRLTGHSDRSSNRPSLGRMTSAPPGTALRVSLHPQPTGKRSKRSRTCHTKQ